MVNLKGKTLEILHKWERILKLDTVYITKNSFWTTLKFTVATLASVASLIAFGNLLPKETYGTYSYILSLAGTLGFLTLSGMSTSISRAFARGQEDVLPFAIKAQLRWNILAIISIATAAIYYGIKGNFTFSISLAILALVLPTAEAYHSFEPALFGKKKFDLDTIITSIGVVFSTAAIVISIILTHNIIVIVGVYALTSFLQNFLGHWYVSRNLPKTSPSPEIKAEMNRTAFHITGSGFIGILAQYLDKLILFQVAGPAALATYSFAIAGPERLKGFIKNWIGIAFPKVSQKNLSEIRSVLYKRIGLALLAGTLMFIIYIIFAPILFKLFLPKYLTSVLYTQVYALALIVIPATIYVSMIFGGQNMLRAIYLISITNSLAKIVLYVVFGLLWQTWGLVIASIASYVANALICIAVWEIEYRRLIKIASRT